MIAASLSTRDTDAQGGVPCVCQVKMEEAGEEVKVVDYWLDDPEENYVPCTNNNGGLNTDCIWYSLTCPCFWRVAWDSLPTWENQDPDPDDLQQMLVYDDVNSKRIYILAPRPNESMHSLQCRNACLYQKLHHPIISIVTTHQFNELQKFGTQLLLLVWRQPCCRLLTNALMLTLVVAVPCGRKSHGFYTGLLPL